MMNVIFLLSTVVILCSSVPVSSTSGCDPSKSYPKTDIIDSNPSIEETEVTFTDEEWDEQELPEDEIRLECYGILPQTGETANPTATEEGKAEGDIAGFSSAKQIAEYLARPLAKSALSNRFGGRQWRNGRVPYTFSSKYSSLSRRTLRNAMKELMAESCIQFEAKKSSDFDYIHIFPGDGCYSYVGRIRGKQELSLDAGCIQKGTIVHELMHALGFFHEQSRSDRDEFVRSFLMVTVNFQNIQRNQFNQFTAYKAYEEEDLAGGYDYGSIMHYGPYAFSKNGQMTIVSKDPAWRQRIGQRRGMSQTDAKKLNQLYSCPKKKPTDNKIVVPSSVTTENSKKTKNKCSNSYGHGFLCKLWFMLRKSCDGFFLKKHCRKTCRAC